MLEKEKLTHKRFGYGEIVHCDAKSMEVFFFQRNQTKRLSVEYVMGNNLIIFDNDSVIKKIDEAIRNEKCRECLAIFSKYDFEGFVHTTSLENFKSIVKIGKLVPRSKLKESYFVDVANQDVIEKTDKLVTESCRFYYYFNTPTNYRANYQRPVIMVFQEDLIYLNNVYFTPRNAAIHDNGITQDINKVKNFCWDGIFERGGFSQSKYYDKGNDYIKGMRNAEFLVNGDVRINKIKQVYFKNEEDKNEAITYCDENLCKKFKVDGSKF